MRGSMLSNARRDYAESSPQSVLDHPTRCKQSIGWRQSNVESLPQRVTDHPIPAVATTPQQKQTLEEALINVSWKEKQDEATRYQSRSACQKPKHSLKGSMNLSNFVRACRRWLMSPKMDDEVRRHAVLVHGRSVVSVGEPEFVPEEEQAGADRYTVGADGSVLTQGDFLTSAKLKRQSKASGGGEPTF